MSEKDQRGFDKDDIDTIRDLVDDCLPWQQLKHMMSAFKDHDRFQEHLAVLSEKVSWPDRILLPYGQHLYIVEKSDGRRIVKCDCGYEFGDYTDNWKLNAAIFVRDTEESMDELYPRGMGSVPSWQVLREYYCPGCQTQLEVEAVPPGYPVVVDFIPDIDAFYRGWLTSDVSGPSSGTG